MIPGALPHARTGRPIRRVLSAGVTPRGAARPDGHLSRGCVAAPLQRSTRHLGEQPHRCLSDLAPGEVYPASPITRAPGGLLHHRFTLTPPSEDDVAVCSLLHFLADRSGWVLPTTLLCGARTFLGTRPAPSRGTVRATRPSGRPVRDPQDTRRSPRPEVRVRTPPSAPGSRSNPGTAAHRRVPRRAPRPDRSR